jgi:hypothetical protein
MKVKLLKTNQCTQAYLNIFSFRLQVLGSNKTASTQIIIICIVSFVFL